WPTDGLPLKNRVNHHALAIDVRGEGGQFVVAPSRNKSGEYRWGSDPTVTKVADAPPWLLDWCRTDRGQKRATGPPSRRGRTAARTDIRKRAVAYLAKLPEAVSGSGGHNATMWAARVVVWGFGLGPDEGFDLLWSEYNPRCRPPWSEKELQHKCTEADEVPFSRPHGWLRDEERDGADRPARPTSAASPQPQAEAPKKPPGPSADGWGPFLPLDEPPPPPPFPLDVLPDKVRKLVEEISSATPCPADFAAVPLLALAAAAIGATRSVQVKHGHIQPSI